MNAYLQALTCTFPLSSQQMLASKGSMLSSKGDVLSSKGDMLLCMILLTTELDARAQLLARIIVQSVDAPEQEYMLSS